MRDQLFATIRQLGLLIESLTLRQVLFNRFTVVIVVFLLAAGSVQAYADANNQGHIQGQVVDGDGNPVANATVQIERVNIRNQLGRINTTTDTDGTFEFTNQTRLLEFRVWAEKEGVGRSQVERKHLYFRGQNTEFVIVIDQEQAS